MYNLKKIGPATYLMEKEAGMLVPGLIIATEELMEGGDFSKPLEQVRNVAYLPGIVGHSIAMPDIHWGYGFPIGGVAAMDPATGVISPGGVGYDINCGVRLAIVPESMKCLEGGKADRLLKKIFDLVPSGVGHGHKRTRGLSERDFKEIAEKGVRFSIENGCGLPEDLDHIESNGTIEEASSEAVSAVAKERGKAQLGTIGSGNHFVEIGEIEQVYQPDIGNAWGVQKGQIYILIHSGSRGFGHQVCQDTLDQFIAKGYSKGLPDSQLVAAPIQSPDGKTYFEAMAMAANFAFNNRQMILHEVRQAFHEVLGIPPQKIKLIYDVCHNIAKFEIHEVEGKKRRLCIHRKGATRAFGPGAEELNPLFRKTGQPVLVPGDMGRASHLMVGMANPLTWCSSCHGAGRARSRVQSSKSWRGRDIFDYMHSQGVEVMASSGRTVAEEMPDAYKDVDKVVDAVEMAKLAGKIARLKPRLVIKG
ncbi:MAG: RtcB family protein [Verrucomicrobia bacterium]|nr:RtcB family protein [Verrucomicrobiota bacterium]